MVFANEPFAHYPPCPSYEVLAPVPPQVIAAGTIGFLVVIGLLLFVAIVAFSLTLGSD